jgi:hypothetical protein
MGAIERYDLCSCGCGDAIVICRQCGHKSGHRHRNNHLCVFKKKRENDCQDAAGV